MKYSPLAIVIARAFLLFVLFFLPEPTFAKNGRDKSQVISASTKKTKVLFDLEISAGYRIDHLDWSIAIEGINVLSELTWDDLIIRQYKLGGQLTLPLPGTPYGLYARAAFGYGEIIGGRNQDSDFDGNNRTLEFSRSNNGAGNGTVLDGSIGAGFQFLHPMEKSKWTARFRTLMGYSHHKQNLKNTNGFQTIPQLGPFSDLNSTYKINWFGPWFGLDFAMEDREKTTLFISLEYHWATSYEATANWNLRKDLAHPTSFKHKASGNGTVVTTGWVYLIRENVSINTTIEYQIWTTEAGINTLFLSKEAIEQLDVEGQIKRNGIIKTRFNEANWESRAFSMSLQYRFQ